MMRKATFFIFMLVAYAFCLVCFSGLVSAEGTRLTSDGITFPDGTVQKTKATETGTPGPQGKKGDTGNTGPQGSKGDAGAQGTKGDAGTKGDKGDAGAQGTIGPQGIQGLKGDAGAKGDTGATGAVGLQGPAGFTSAICPVPKTGQTKCYDADGDLISCSGTGQDGNLQRGFSCQTHGLLITGTERLRTT